MIAPVFGAGTIQPSWDWSDPSVRSYPHLRLKLVLGYVLGVAAVSVLTYLTRDHRQSALDVVGPVAIGYTVAYPFIVAIVLGNIKRLRSAPDDSPSVSP